MCVALSSFFKASGEGKNNAKDDNHFEILHSFALRNIIQLFLIVPNKDNNEFQRRV